MDLFIFFSEILGRKVIDQNNDCIGTLCDIGMNVGKEVYPKSSYLVVKRGFFGKRFAQVPWEKVYDLSKAFRVSVVKSEIQYQKQRPQYELTLCRDVLDQQVVDTDDQKVVRVNDVSFLKVDNFLYMAHMDVGLRGLARRLGWAKMIDNFLKSFFPNVLYLTKEDFIPWKNTQILTLGRTKNVLRLNIAREKLSQIPPAELAEIMEDLDIFEKYSLFKSFEPLVQQRVFSDLSTSEQEEIIDQMSDEEAGKLLESIPSDDAVDLLLSLPKEKTSVLMRLMGTKKSKKLRELLDFERDSAGGLMTTEYLFLPQNALVKDAMKKIQDNVQSSANIYYIYIVDEKHHLLGFTSLRNFINKDSWIPILDTCYPKNVFVRTDDGMEEIALLLEKYKFSVIPVLDENDVLKGVITIDDVLEELISIAWGKYKEKL
ncbi:MAG: CBS domain-containing protein [Candidatus Omnitrophica bacterium]|nr:CBS domain-containing protein [Candidatus Omnitrophota bacterium]